MAWELEPAKMPDLKLRLAAVKLNKENITPHGLLGVGNAWATSFTRDHIVQALKDARVN